MSVRLGEDDRLCLLVVIGVREDGARELPAVDDGYRESTDSWAGVLRDLKGRGVNEPKLVTGDGALGAWPAQHAGTGQAGCVTGQERQRQIALTASQVQHSFPPTTRAAASTASSSGPRTEPTRDQSPADLLMRPGRLTGLTHSASPYSMAPCP